MTRPGGSGLRSCTAIGLDWSAAANSETRPRAECERLARVQAAGVGGSSENRVTGPIQRSGDGLGIGAVESSGCAVCRCATDDIESDYRHALRGGPRRDDADAKPTSCAVSP